MRLERRVAAAATRALADAGGEADEPGGGEGRRQYVLLSGLTKRESKYQLLRRVWASAV